MTIKVLPSQRPFDEADYKKRLMDEYKILQDKIDKIGSFGFTIKGWSVTAVLAASAAASTIKDPDDTFGVTLSLLVMSTCFFLFEYRQVKLSRRFGRRVRTLETELWKIDRQTTPMISAPFPIPYIAQLRDDSPASGIITRSITTRRYRTRFLEWLRLLWRADLAFYVILMAFALVLPSVTHSGGALSRLKSWFGGKQYSVPTMPIYRNRTIPEC